MTDFSARLRSTFCAECRERMLRAAALLANYEGQDSAVLLFDALHQEFDSLCGAARAVDAAPIERFARQTASFLRHLRDTSPRYMDAKSQALVRDAVDLALSCGGRSSDCLDCNCPEIDALGERIAFAMRPQ